MKHIEGDSRQETFFLFIDHFCKDPVGISQMRFSIQCQKHYCKCDQISANLVGLIYFKMHFTEMEVNEWASGLAQFHKITYHQSVHDFEVFSHQKK